MKKSIFFISLILLGLNMMAQYDGAVGTEGCQAISQDDERIISWALGVEVNRGFWDYGDERVVDYGKAYMAIGKPDSTTTTAISLGEGGDALITFDRPIINGEGKDFVVFENAFGPTFLELAFVEVSSDGENFFRFPCNSTSYHNSDNVTEGRTAEHYNNLAGKYELGWGVGFDLSDIADNDLLDKNNIRFVRLVDVINGISTDTYGNIIYDGVSWPTYSQGFDLTGIGVINGGTPYKVADFENNTWLADVNSYEIVDMTSNYDVLEDGVYSKNHISNGLNFLGTGYYMQSWDWFMAMGFGASNVTNDTTATGNSTNLTTYYTSAPKYALEGLGKTYLHAYYDAYNFSMAEHNVVKTTSGEKFNPMGVYISSSLAAKEDIEISATENLYLKITATGYDENNVAEESVDIYLYDVSNNINKLADWHYMDLSSLGEVSKIVFSIECNDSWVSNYFCLDGFTYKDAVISSNNEVLAGGLNINMYPNPAQDYLTIEIADDKADLQIFDLQGRLVRQEQLANQTNTINTSDLQGTYILKIISGKKVETKKLIVR